MTLSVVLLPWLAPAVGQITVGERQRLDFERPESWAAARATAATLFLGSGPPPDMEFGDLRIGFDASHIPRLSRPETRVGFNGTKLEDLNKSPVFGRVWLAVGLPAGLTAHLGWTPPVTIDGLKADGLYAVAVERRLIAAENWRSGVRIYGQSGDLAGSVTCSRDVYAVGINDFERNPFLCARPSSDEVELDYYGIELSGSRVFDDTRFEAFASLALTRMQPQMQVNAPLFGDVIDRSRRVTSGRTETVSIGLLYRPSARWEGFLALRYTPLDVRRPPDFSSDSDDFWSLAAGLRLDIGAE